MGRAAEMGEGRIPPGLVAREMSKALTEKKQGGLKISSTVNRSQSTPQIRPERTVPAPEVAAPPPPPKAPSPPPGSLEVQQARIASLQSMKNGLHSKPGKEPLSGSHSFQGLPQ